MTIIETIKSEGLRIPNNNRWLYWDVNYHKWIVRGHEYGKHTTDILIETTDEDMAVRVLLQEEEEE